jgi:hypothetical protein
MMTPDERVIAIEAMTAASKAFYTAAVRIGNHPFVEFTGLINEYIQACREAAAAGVDFSECNTHSGQPLPMHPHNVRYVNEKLECIFTGRSVMAEVPPAEGEDAAEPTGSANNRRS